MSTAGKIIVSRGHLIVGAHLDESDELDVLIEDRWWAWSIGCMFVAGGETGRVWRLL